GKWDLPVVDGVSFQSTRPEVFFGDDAALGPKNIITAVAHGHQAAISIHLYCSGQNVLDRPAPTVNLFQQKMGIHEWIYDNVVAEDDRYKVPDASLDVTLKDLRAVVEVGFDRERVYREPLRCLDCDVETVFTPILCIECDA